MVVTWDPVSTNDRQVIPSTEISLSLAAPTRRSIVEAGSFVTCCPTARLLAEELARLKATDETESVWTGDAVTVVVAVRSWVWGLGMSRYPGGRCGNQALQAVSVG